MSQTTMAWGVITYQNISRILFKEIHKISAHFLRIGTCNLYVEYAFKAPSQNFKK